MLRGCNLKCQNKPLLNSHHSRKQLPLPGLPVPRGRVQINRRIGSFELSQITGEARNIDILIR